MSMSDDDLKQFNEQLAEGARLQADSNRMQAMQLEVLTKLAQAQGINIDSINKSKNAFDGLKGSTNKQSAAAEANAYATEQMRVAQENFNKTLTSTTASAVSFGKALLSNEQGFAKYNDTLKNAGDAAMTLGKNFGLLGGAIGVAIKGLTMAAEQFTKQADNTLKATDSLSKLGGVGSLTADQVLNMGQKAGLTSANLEIMTKAAAKANTGMGGLGVTVGDGIIAFGKMTAVTSEQRQAFQRMGVSQEALMEQQADYVKLQEMSGKSMASSAKDGDKLRKQSLEYAENLARLSALTGKSADKLQEEQNAAMLEYEEIVATRIEDDKIRKLKAEGRKDEAEGLEKEQAARKAYITQVTNQLGKEAGLQVAKVARTGAFDEKTAGLAALGISAEQVQGGFKGKTVEEARAGAATFTQNVKEQQSERLGQLGTALQFGGEDLGKKFFLGKESLQETGKFAERNETQANIQAAALVKGAAEGSAEAGGKAATDPAQISRNKLTETEIAAKVALDNFIASFNPLLKGFDAATIAALALAAAATAAAVALAKISASAIGNRMGGGGPDVPDKTKGKGGTLKRIGGAVVKGGAVALGGAALGMGADYAKEKGYEKTGAGLDVAGKAASYAGTGAMVGSVIPGIGTAVGAGVGLVAGTGMGLWENRKTIFEGGATPAPAPSPTSMGNEGRRGNKPSPQPPEGSENDTSSASKSVDLSKIMKFGTKSGTQQNFEALQPTFKDAVTAAAIEYNSVTGNKLTINSAKRDPADQQRLWDESVAAGRPGKGPTGMAIAKPGRSLHEKGEAVDIQNYEDPNAVAALNKQGLSQKVPGDPVHFQAQLGGILDGPMSGYPVEGTMHGREAIIPLNPDSIITKLLTTSEAQIKQEMNTNNITTTTNDMSSQIMSEMYTMMEEKFNAMIAVLEDGNDHTEKLVRFSTV